MNARTMQQLKRLAGAGLGTILMVVFAGGLFGFYRHVWEHGKRLREVVPGKLYRSGQLTVDGFRDAVERYGIKSVVNLQDEFPDPRIRNGTFDKQTTGEQEMCRELGVRYFHVMPDLIPPDKPLPHRPKAVNDMLALYDQEDLYPMLVHCKAGLHRTGVLLAVYRMEYQNWPKSEAYRELKGHGFGDSACTEANLYVSQYVLNHTVGQRHGSKPTKSEAAPCSP